MSVTVHKGRLLEIGPGIAEHSDFSTSSTYEYVEFEEGTVLRNLQVRGGLSGKLDTALEGKQDVELHCTPFIHKKLLLVAVKLADGKTYASRFDPNPILAHLIVIGLALVGIVTLPLFGIGLILLVVAWMINRARRINAKARRHVAGLPNVVVL